MPALLIRQSSWPKFLGPGTFPANVSRISSVNLDTYSMSEKL